MAIQFYEVLNCWFSLYIVHLISHEHYHGLPALKYVRIGNINFPLTSSKIIQTWIQDDKKHNQRLLPLVWHRNYCCLKCILAWFKYTLIYYTEYLTMWTVALSANQVSLRSQNILAASCSFYSSSYSDTRLSVLVINKIRHHSVSLRCSTYVQTSWVETLRIHPAVIE